MARQAFTFPGSDLEGSGYHDAVLVNPAFIEGDAVAYLREVNHVAGSIQVRLSATATGAASDSGPQFTAAFETFDSAFEFDSSDGESVTLKGSDHPDNSFRDTSEPYFWTPDNSNAWRNFATSRTAQDTITLTFDDGAPPAITDTQITSTPEATSDTYGFGETIQFTVTYDGAVDVDTAGGTPEFPMNLVVPVGSPEYAAYASGSGTNELIFEWTVAATDSDTNGIFLYGDTDSQNRGEIRLNGGQIYNAGTTIVADLTTLNRGTQSAHRVDGTLRFADITVSFAAGAPVFDVTPEAQTVTNRDITVEFNAGTPGFAVAPEAATVINRDVSIAFEAGTPAIDITPEGLFTEPLTANAGADQTTDAGDEVTLDASGSTDPDNSITSYAWLQTAGDNITLDDATAAQPTFTAPTTDNAQTLTFEVTVTNAANDTDTDTVDIFVSSAHQRLPQTFRQAVFASETDEVVLPLLTISHPDLGDDIRVVNNWEDIYSRGMRFVKMPFEVILPDESDDRPPRAQLRIQNVTREIVEHIRTVDTAVSVKIEIIMASTPDEPEATFSGLQLGQVEADAFFISGDLTVADLTTESYPARNFSPASFPGIF